MKFCIRVCLLLIITIANGQVRDTRAELDIHGRVNRISVSPDEKIWLVTALSNIYYTVNIDSNWHSYASLYKRKEKFDYHQPDLDRISFFNKDTAILTGYISTTDTGYTQNGYYYTKNGGLTWSRHDFGDDGRIADIFVTKEGRAWMGGSSGHILYSDDFGLHWKKLNTPYDTSSRTNLGPYGDSLSFMTSIYMKNSNEGISGSIHNHIFITTNNWQTSEPIATPYDQKKYIEESGYSNGMVDQIVIWGNFIVARQNRNIYYSNIDSIDWKEFPINLVVFAKDEESNTLFAVTDSLTVVSFTTPTEFKIINPTALQNYPLDLKIVNRSCYIVDGAYEIYKINTENYTHTIPYTTDNKISAPEKIVTSQNMTWGINGSHLYLSDNGGQDWYRENVFQFDLADITLVNDSSAILWDGTKNNYSYSLNDHTPKLYRPVSPIKNILVSPLTSITITSGTNGCSYYLAQSVRYQLINDSTLRTTQFTTIDSKQKHNSAFHHTIETKSILNILSSINSGPSITPSIQEFGISKKDKARYLLSVKERLKSDQPYRFNRKKKVDKTFYYGIADNYDTLSVSTMKNVFDQSEGILSTTSHWISIKIGNKNNDTLFIYRTYYYNSLPWHFPWEFKFKGLHFNCYNLAFSKFVDSATPKKFMKKEYFDNSVLLMGIADYLFNQK